MSSNKIAAPRGMHDLLPAQAHIRAWLENQLVGVAQNFGFAPIRTPLAEPLELFKRSVGEATDIVEKEMYLLEQEGSQHLALRPEGTAGCVRALLQHHLQPPQKLYYLGPMFRYERPQAGRYRQFSQFGVEYFGGETMQANCEILQLCQALWHRLGLAPTLEINFLGSRDERRAYNASLVAFLRDHQHKLDSDSQRRIEHNPLRILDSKHPDTLALLDQVPGLVDSLGESSRQALAELRTMLDALGIAHTCNPRLVRGLDYYNDLVFEWKSQDLGAQSTLCAGGRYDQLVSDLGGKQPVSAIGFALGLERLELVLEQAGKLPGRPTLDALLVGEASLLERLTSLARLRAALPGWCIDAASGSSLGKQLARANKSGATMALIIGPDERAADKVTIKYLREEKAQITLPLATLANQFHQA